MNETIIYVGHPNLEESSSQQFLLSSGSEITDVTYVDLWKEFEEKQGFISKNEQNRLCQYQRILLQFPLYWYQAPAIIKEWIDITFEDKYSNYSLYESLQGKELGLIVTADVKEAHYQAGGRVGYSLSTLLTPYQALAQYYHMKFIPIFAIHQFNYLTERDKMKLMFQYTSLIETGNHTSHRIFQTYLTHKLASISQENLNLSEADKLIFQMWLDDFVNRGEEITELFSLSNKGYNL